MLQRPCVYSALLALSLFWASTPAAADRALVLTGNDFGLYSVDTVLGTVQAEHSFTGYPGSGYLNDSYYVAVISGEDLAHIYNLVSLAPVATLFPGAGSNPYAAVIDPAGRVFVTCLKTDEVVRFDLAGHETGRVSVGVSPQSIVFHHGLIYVANTGFRFSDFGYDPGTVMVLDPPSLTVVDTLEVGLNPQSLAFTGSDLHALCTGDYFSVFGAVHVLETTSFTATDTVFLGGSPGTLAIDGATAYTADYFGGIYSYDVTSHAVIHGSTNPILVGGSGYTSCAPDGLGNLYVTLYDDDILARVSLGTETVSATYPVGDGPQHVVLASQSPTPVRLLSFRARRTTSGVLLSWQVSAAPGWAVLTLERLATGGADWEHVAEVSGTDSWVDANSLAGRRYRLSAILRDGRNRILGTVDVPAALSLSLRVVRNPSPGVLALEARGIEEGGRLELYDLSGRLIDARTVTADGLFELEAPAAGQYFVRLEQGAVVATSRAVVLP